MAEPVIAHPVNFEGSPWARWLLARCGWTVVCHGFPSLQGVAIIYPHTSNWDFVVMILAKWAVGIPARFWGKDSLFRIPVLGPWVRWLGGIPLDRSSPRGAVGEMVALIQAHKAQGQVLWLGLSPEGTRRWTAGWRSGFYQVAVGADVPLAVIALDYGRKTVRMTDFVHLSGQPEDDYRLLQTLYHGVQGLHTGQAAPIQVLPPTHSPSGAQSHTSSAISNYARHD